MRMFSDPQTGICWRKATCTETGDGGLASFSQMDFRVGEMQHNVVGLFCLFISYLSTFKEVTKAAYNIS